MEALRLFVALELPPEVRAVLVAGQQNLATQQLAIRWADPAGAHLTLKFLGSVASTEVDAVTVAMQQGASGHASFTLQTTGLGAFPNLRQPRVVWLGLDGALQMLHSLQQDIERWIAPLGYPAEQHPFNPHLTLGRTQKDATTIQRTAIGRAVQQASALTQATWTVDSVSLMRSTLRPQGPIYTQVARQALTGDRPLL
ncbi:MAG: 2'-5' RNA ligase [uncultured Chloroflexia bacterium]|uniref:RNA 2',3'-cyclic phosphodiesterase n=1 Tax=uncultured Chloroflexia bacterium TaxID=1672391 RepID=A0A6J4NTB5_9CHLR|nr:MAG: 2'-5' RNA ligase [uncultured Chloroflexia bacterium]